MAKKHKILSGKFILGAVIYAVVFLALMAAGLTVFWKFIEAYEFSRPKNTVNAYMDQLTVERMCAASDELYASVDQSIILGRNQFDQVIRDSITEEVTCAKKTSESSEDRQVYVLRCGRQVIGEFVIEAGEEDAFGFRAWQVAEESFDFSHLMGSSVSITVPSEYEVYTGDSILLDESYITEKDIHYSALEEYYDDYSLPTMVTYTVDNFLGEMTLVAKDPSGNAVEITPETDMNSLLPQCTAEEAAKVEAFAKEFMRVWVIFSGSANDNVTYNYHIVRKMLSSDGVMAQRLYSALEGLTYAQSGGDSIQELTINRIVPLEDGYYVCDVTYIVQTYGRNGPVNTTNNMKLMLVTETDGLKLKTMESY